MARWIALAALLLAMGAALPAWAGDAEDCAHGMSLIKTEPDRVVAACRRLANSGDLHGQGSLGMMYFLGLGVPEDNVQAYMWLSLAAAQGVVGNTEFRDSYVAILMTPAQIEQAKALVAAWKPTTRP